MDLRLKVMSSNPCGHKETDASYTNTHTHTHTQTHTLSFFLSLLPLSLLFSLPPLPSLFLFLSLSLSLPFSLCLSRPSLPLSTSLPPSASQSLSLHLLSLWCNRKMVPHTQPNCTPNLLLRLIPYDTCYNSLLLSYNKTKTNILK